MKIKPAAAKKTPEEEESAVILDPKAARLQRSIDLRRKCLRALFDWSNYEGCGASVSLAECCRKYGVAAGVVYAMRKEPKVKEMMDAAMAQNVRQGVVASENLLLRMLDEAGKTVVLDTEVGPMAIEKAPLKPSDAVSIAGHFRRVQGGGFEKKDTGNTVLVQVNLPAPASYAAPVRAEARVIAEDEFGDLLNTREPEEDEPQTD